MGSQPFKNCDSLRVINLLGIPEENIPTINYDSTIPDDLVIYCYSAALEKYKQVMEETLASHLKADDMRLTFMLNAISQKQYFATKKEIENLENQNTAITEALDGKLDKNLETSNSKVDIAYGKDYNGNPKMIMVKTDASYETIAKRNNKGRLKTTDPSEDLDCVNKRTLITALNGANKAVSFKNYSSMITSLNADNGTYSIGQNIMIVTLNVPDLWVSEIAEESVSYNYISDDDFINELNTSGHVQVGYFKLSALETQKVDLTEYQHKIDNTLETESKEIIEAINEVNKKIEEKEFSFEDDGNGNITIINLMSIEKAEGGAY